MPIGIRSFSGTQRTQLDVKSHLQRWSIRIVATAENQNRRIKYRYYFSDLMLRKHYVGIQSLGCMISMWCGNVRAHQSGNLRGRWLRFIPFYGILASQIPPPNASTRKCTRCNCGMLQIYDRQKFEAMSTLPSRIAINAPPANVIATIRVLLRHLARWQAPTKATLRTSALAPPPKFKLLSCVARIARMSHDAETATVRKEQKQYTTKGIG